MSTTTTIKIHWRNVPVNRLDGREPTSREHVEALDEYRRTTGIVGYVLAEVRGDETPEEVDALCEQGPEVDEIDWSGFDEELAAETTAAAE